MKNIENKILFGLLVCLSVSCDRRILDQQPYDKLSIETYYTTTDQIEAGVGGLYQTLKSDDLANLGAWDGFSDDGYATYDYGGGTTASRVGLIPTLGGGYPVSLYTTMSQGIARANTMEEILNKSDFLADADKSRLLGETLFLRAYYYFWLARTYGNVPLYIDTKVDIANPLSNSTRKEVLEQAHKDVDYAIANLPDKVYEGHAVKGTAQALKMHAYLLEGNFAGAVDVFKTFSAKHSLADSYNNNFLAGGQRGNAEILLSVGANPPSASIGPYNSADLYLGAWGAVQPTKDLADSFEANDPRFALTLVPKSSIRSNADDIRFSALSYSSNITGYLLNKFLQLPYTEIPGYGYISPQDYVLLRYADVLLMYAEAENEVSGPTQAVYDAINKIRTRVNMPTLPMGLTKEDMRQRIWNERRVELAFEGSRYFDLRRWDDPNNAGKKMAETKLKGFTKSYPANSSEAPVVYEKHYEYWPFNQNVLLNNKNMKQNPGY